MRSLMMLAIMVIIIAYAGIAPYHEKSRAYRIAEARAMHFLTYRKAVINYYFDNRGVHATPVSPNVLKANGYLPMEWKDDWDANNSIDVDGNIFVYASLGRVAFDILHHSVHDPQNLGIRSGNLLISPKYASRVILNFNPNINNGDTVYYARSPRI